VAVAEAPAADVKPAKSKKKLIMIGGIAAVLVLGGGFFAYTKFMGQPEPAPTPPPVAKKAPPPAPADSAQPGPTPSDTLNAAAKAPVNAVNKAQQVVAARDASEQAKADSILDPAAQKVATEPAAAKAPATQKEITTTTLGGGVTATTQLEVAAEATPAFRAFVANAKVSGVFQGNPPRAFINGKLTRAGETVDASLGITFDSIDAERKLMVFKDRTGASVARKY
jgi:hypothetical protein